MPINLIYWIAFMLPLLIVMVVMPTVSDLGQRLDLSEKSKSQVSVSVMGGMLVTAVVCSTLIALGAVVNLDKLFPAVCMMVCLFVLGMIEDAVKIHASSKIILEVIIILVIIFCGRFRIDNLCGLFGVHQMGYLPSVLVTLAVGLFVMNATSMFNGIDGLLSGVTTISSLLMGISCMLYGRVDFAILSLAMSGAMLWMFVFGVWSNKFKMFLGHSGALVVGVYLFLSCCVDPSWGEGDHQNANYYIGFLLAINAAPIFDAFRVMVRRLMRGVLPFGGDRSHIYYMLEDLGFSDPLISTIMVLDGLLMYLVWLLTASLGVDANIQFGIIVLLGATLYWLPCELIDIVEKRDPEAIERVTVGLTAFSDRMDVVTQVMSRFVDNVVYARFGGKVDSDKE